MLDKEKATVAANITLSWEEYQRKVGLGSMSYKRIFLTGLEHLEKVSGVNPEQATAPTESKFKKVAPF